VKLPPLPTKVGVIQSRRLQPKEGQKAAAELETKLGPRKKELESRQSEIKDPQDRLAARRQYASDSAGEDLLAHIDTKTKSYNRH
jgi:Skp family chaperone for outer membrane proteins